MRSASLAVWGAVLIAMAAVLWIWSGSLGPAVPLGAAGIAALLIGLGLSVGANRPAGPLALADQSLPAVLVAVGIAVSLIALVGGWWLVLIGGAIALAGLAGLVREHRASRRVMP